VSSTESAQNILANGIIGPLILEVCDCMMLRKELFNENLGGSFLPCLPLWLCAGLPRWAATRKV